MSDAHSMVSSPTVVGGDIPASPAPSVAPTTVSNVKKIVADSKFHDETLCQLLDAARLNLIGEEAKKALNRAARARVIELRDLRAAAGVQAEVSGLCNGAECAAESAPGAHATTHDFVADEEGEEEQVEGQASSQADRLYRQGQKREDSEDRGNRPGGQWPYFSKGGGRPGE